jgi:acetolactate synthase-1/2/3 large subunit
MAEADGKLTGTPAVAMATRGVGASNLAIGVHTARQDSTPMLVLLGQVETDFLGREAFQEVDLAAFYAPITKWSATVHRADRLAEMVARALRIATSGRPGPVMLALPADVLGEMVPDDPRAGVTAPPRSGPAPGEAREIARRIAAARSPRDHSRCWGARGAGGVGLLREAFDCGVYAAWRRQDVFPNSHPNYLGHLALGAQSETLKALEDADLVVVVGSRLSEVTTQTYSLPRPDQAVIQVDLDPAEVGATLPVEHGMVSDAGAALAALRAQAPSPTPTRNWTEAHQTYLDSSSIPPGRATEGIDPARVVAALNEILPEDAIVTNDAGNFAAFLHRYRRYDRPNTQLAPTNGAMGYGVPAAVAAKLAAPEREVVAVAGDGGFLMTGQELETAVRYGAGITVVVFRNGMHGTIAMHQARALGRTAGVEIGDVDLAAYARSLGAEGYTVRDPEDLAPALQTALASEAVSLLDVVTDPDVISPSARLSELAKVRHKLWTRVFPRPSWR